MREKLPGRRHCTNSEFVFQGLQVDLQCGYYGDGRLGEVFMSTRRAGSVLDVVIRDAAVLISIALQHGATLDELAKSCAYSSEGWPDGLVATLQQHLQEDADATAE